MKICVATDVHPPDDQRITKEIRSLLKLGGVCYIHPEGEVKDMEIEQYEIPRYSSRFKRIIRGTKDVYKIARRILPDFFHFHDPELIPVGVKLAKQGIKVIYDVHENYPAVILTKNWIPKWMRKVVSKLFEMYENLAVKRFYGVVVVTENMCERFSKYTKCALVPNYPDLKDFKGLKKIDRNDGKVRFIYVGSIDEDRAIVEMMEAFRKVREKLSYVEFYMVGPIFSQKLENYIRSFNVPGFVYHPRVPHRRALEMVAQSDVGMIIIHRNPSKEISSPVKLFEYTYFGLPVIASDFEYWKKTLASYKCVYYVDPNDVGQISNIMSSVAEFLKSGGKFDCDELEYTWDLAEKELIGVYKSGEKI